MHEAAMSMLRAAADTGVPTLRTTCGITKPIVVSMRPGRLLRVSVVRAGIAPGRVHDCDVLIDAASANLVALIQPRICVLNFSDWPLEFGICIVPGDGMMLAVAFW
jgi:hypothetical protein